MTKIVEIHRCVGGPECETPAVCDECGDVATEAKPVVVLQDEDGEYFVCVEHISPAVIAGYNDVPPAPEGTTVPGRCPHCGAETEVTTFDDGMVVYGTEMGEHECDSEAQKILREESATEAEAEEAAREPEAEAPETRWCVSCLAERSVTAEYVTMATSDPTTAYALACGHHTIDL